MVTLAGDVVLRNMSRVKTETGVIRENRAVVKGEDEGFQYVASGLTRRFQCVARARANCAGIGRRIHHHCGCLMLLDTSKQEISHLPISRSVFH
jgi:hypothetical protein